MDRMADVGAGLKFLLCGEATVKKMYRPQRRRRLVCALVESLESRRLLAGQMSVAFNNSAITNGQGTAVNLGVSAPGTQFTFVVTNTSAGDEAITGTAIPSGFILDNGLPATIHAGASNNLVISVDNSSFGNKSGTLTINFTDPGPDTFSFPLAASVPQPSVSATLNGSAVNSGDTEDYGLIAQNDPPPQMKFTFTNPSSGYLSISGVNVTSGLTVTNGLPSTLAPGDSNDLWVAVDTSTTGQLTGDITVTTNDPNNTSFVIHVTEEVTTPSLTADAAGTALTNNQGTPVDWGIVAEGGAKHIIFGVTNTSQVNLETANLTVPAGYIVTEPLRGTIAPGTTDHFTIDVDTTSAGIKSGNISFTSNDPNNATFTFPVTADVEAAAIQIKQGNTPINEGDTLNFGSVAVGATQPTITLTVSDTGTGQLQSVNVSVPTGFTIIQNLPHNIPAGTSKNLIIAADTSLAGLLSGTITITSNDPTFGNFNVTGQLTVTGARFQLATGSTVLANGQSTAVNFGGVQPEIGSQITFTATNIGRGALGITNVQVPAGFTLVSSLPGSLAQGAQGSLVIGVDTSIPGSHSGNLVISTDDPNMPTFTVPLTANVLIPHIQILQGGTTLTSGQSTAIDFGRPFQGAAAPQKTFVVKNTGTGDLVVGNVTAPTGFSIITNLPAVIPAGGSSALVIAASTASLGVESGNVTVPSSDASNASFLIPVTAHVVVPGLQVFNGNTELDSGLSTIALGNAFLNGSSHVTLTLQNQGSGDLHISSVTAPTGFTVVTAPPGTITAGSSANLVIGVDTASAGLKSGSLTIASDDVNDPNFSIALTADVLFPVKLGAGGTKMVAYTEADGTVAKLTWTGPGGATLGFTGTGTASTTAKNLTTVTGTGLVLTDILLAGTTKTSSLFVTAKGGDKHISVGMIEGAVVMNQISAAPVSVSGGVLLGGVHQLTLGDVAGSTLVIGNSNGAANITLGQVSDSTLEADGGIQNLRTASWTDSNGLHGITSLKMANMTIGGAFDSPVTITGAGKSFGNGTIKGALTGGAWTLAGNATRIAATSVASAWTGAVTGSVGVVMSKGDFAGTLHSASLGLLQAGSITGAQISTTGNVGIVHSNGAMTNSKVAAGGNIVAVQASSLTGDKIFAGAPIKGDVLPHAAGDFAAAKRISLVSTKHFSDTQIAASVLGAMNLGTVVTNNGGVEEGVAGTKIASLFAKLDTGKKLVGGNINSATALNKVLATAGGLGDFVVRLV